MPSSAPNTTSPSPAAALTGSELRFQSLFDQAPVSFQLLAEDGRTVQVNRAWQKLWQTHDGDGLVEFVLNSYNVLQDPQLELKGITAYLRRAFAGESVRIPAILYDTTELGEFGRARWVTGFAHPIRDKKGRVREVMLMHEDITDRVQAETAMRTSEERFRSLVMASSQMVWTAMPDGRVTDDSPSWRAYTGQSYDEWKEHGWLNALHPDDRGHAASVWRDAVTGAQFYEVEYRLRRADGNYRWNAVKGVPIRDEHGAIREWIGANTDVHEAKLTAQSLAHLNQTLEDEVAKRTADRDRMWRLSTDIMLVAAFDSSVVAINPAWTAVLGWTDADLLGKRFLDLVHPDDIQATLDEIAKLSYGAKTLRFENRYRHRDGSYRWLAWSAVPDVQYMHAVARDITQDKLNQSALEQAEHALRQAQKLESIGKLTGGVAHDFNNILQVISGSLQLLQHYVGSNPAAAKRLTTAMSAVERGAKLSSHLLAFARRQPLQPKVIDPGRTLREMDDLLRRALGEPIAIETIVSDGCGTMLVDQHQLENVVLNLAINARDAMPEGGRLTIEVGNVDLDEESVQLQEPSAAGQYVMVAVSDTGVGMTPDVLEQACDPFFTTKREGEGTGLGLSMAYGFVKQSGGHFRIYSELGVGTTVKMYFPRSHAAEDPVASAVMLPVVGGSETVLVVEDDIEVQGTVVAMLGDLGYRVLKADDAQAALVVLKSGLPVDLLFTDVVMPGPLRSPELARLAKQLHPAIEVLFTSGYTRDAIVHGGRLDEGVQLISKPYRREELARKIRAVLSNGR
ncbi:MAG TPA: PAS domain S-box protein [Burkholderiaceae bacterium]